MKKLIKPFILILALLLMSTTLTGCAKLDNMRDHHAVWTTQGSTDSITYKGTEYKLLPTKETPFMKATYTSTNDPSIYVTEPDVPVLLSTSLSRYMSISYDKNFIFGHLPGEVVVDNDTYDIVQTAVYEENYVIYCKAELYDEVVSQIEEGIEYTQYGYEYWKFNEKTGNDEYFYYFLSDEEAGVIDKVVAEVEPVQKSQLPYDGMYYLTLDKLSENHYFAKTSYEIYQDNLDTYYLVSYSEVLDEYTHYEVPDELNNMFDKITEKSHDMYEIWNEDVEV